MEKSVRGVFRGVLTIAMAMGLIEMIAAASGEQALGVFKLALVLERSIR